MPSFGEQRLVRPDVSRLHRALYRLMGVPDPGHYLHHRYLASALDQIDIHPSSVLDAGCGAGDHTIYLARRYPNAWILGIDLNEALVVRCRSSSAALRLRNIQFEAVDITTFDAVERHDLVVSIDALEHIPRQVAALERLAIATRRGGWSYFHIPTQRRRPVPLSSWLGAFHEWAQREHLADELTPDEFIHRVADCGFNVKKTWNTFGYWTGELATSLFALGFRNSAANRLYQAAVAPLCRALAIADRLPTTGTRYAVGVLSQRPS